MFREIILCLCLNSPVYTECNAKITGFLREGRKSWKKYPIQCKNKYRHLSIGLGLNLLKPTVYVMHHQFNIQQL